MIPVFTEDILRSYLPATFAPVAGERPLVERLSHFLTSAALRVEDFTGADLPDSVMEDSVFVDAWKRSVALIALEDAIPALDLILTPNGFATVGNSQVVPASAARTAALREKCLEDAAKSIQQAILRLCRSQEWLSTDAGRRETSSVAVGLALSYPAEPQWSLKEHAKTRAIIQRSQDYIADHFISRPLMKALAMEAHTVPKDSHELRRRAIGIISGALLLKISSERDSNSYVCNFRPLMSLADTVNSFPEVFPEFVGTETQETLFNSKFFENEKGSSGYFF